MNVYYSGPLGLSTTISFSLQIENTGGIAESSSHSLASSSNVGATDLLKSEEDYIKTPWSKKQLDVLVEAKMKYSQEMRGKKLWEKVAQEVRSIRPNANAQTCKKKYSRLMQVTPVEDKKLQDEEIAALSLVRLINPGIFDNESQQDAQTEKIINVQKNLKRKIDETSMEEKSNDSSKRQKISQKWKRWEESESAQLREIMQRVKGKGKDLWLKVSEEIGSKTPQQCEHKWKMLNKSNHEKKQPPWTDIQMKALLDARQKYDRPSWTEIAHEVESVRPAVTPTECRKKYQYMNRGVSNSAKISKKTK